MVPLGTIGIALDYYLPPAIARLEDPLAEGHSHLFVPYLVGGLGDSTPLLGPKMTHKWKIETKYQWGGIRVLLLGLKSPQ